jgi:hypothetical protein
MTWEYMSRHAHLLPSGKVLFWQAKGDAQVWDPETSVVTKIPTVAANIFCSGHSFLADGRLHISGGHVTTRVGIPDSYVYDVNTNSWTRLQNMSSARWYPSNITLPNGDVLAVSGQIDSTVGMNPLPSVWEAATGIWRDLTSAQLVLPYYPFLAMAPNGKVFLAGPAPTTRFLDTTGTGAWSVVADSNYGTRNWGSAVTYASGKVLLTGGTTCGAYATCTTVRPTNTAEIIDLSAPAPAWSYTGPMAFARKQHNVTALPDGTVLVTGGSGGTEGPNQNSADPTKAAEVWNPDTGQWTTLASAALFRGYHSTAVLLPDGRVLTAGGQLTGKNAEIYSPPYLFKGARPAVMSVPASVHYGQTFRVETPDAESISKVTLIAPGSVTHSYDQNQRMVRPAFSKSSGAVDITAPANGNDCPAGFYMLFIVNSNGVPSIGRFVKIGPAPPPMPPAAPGNLTATTISSSQISLAWTDNSDNETGFKIERATGSNPFGQIALVSANITSYSDSGLSPATTYQYRVLAINGSLESPASNTASATTAAVEPLPVTTAPVHKLLSNSILNVATSTLQVGLDWSLSSGAAVEYELEWKLGTGAFGATPGGGRTVVATNSATVALQVAGASYQFRVRGKNSAGAYGAWKTGVTFLITRTQDTVLTGTPSMSYVGTWTRASGYSYQTTADTSATYRSSILPRPASIGWVGAKGPSRGQASVSIDGGPPVIIDLYSPTTINNVFVFTQALAPGQHTMKITVLGTKAAASTGTRVDVESVIVLR